MPSQRTGNGFGPGRASVRFSAWNRQAARSGAGSGQADAYLRSFYRGATVGAMLGPPEAAGRFFYNEDASGFNFYPVHAKLNNVLDEIAAKCALDPAPTVYVGSTTVDTCLPGFRDHNDLALGARDALVSIWIGNRTRIPAHYDVPDNLACVAAGRRRFTLFPPEQLANLYVGPLDFTPAGQSVSLVDLHQPDLARYPRFAAALAQAQSAELEVGDALFIPSMWWHHVEGLAPFNILLNYWWRQSPDWMDTPFNTLLLGLMTLRELPPAQRAAWQQQFDHYVFARDGGGAPLDADGARALRAQLLRLLSR